MSTRYKKTRLIGKGRAGEVYEAEDTMLPRKVAIRRFHAHSTKAEALFDEWEERYIELVSALSRLAHPQILGVIDGGIDEDGPYLVTAHLDAKKLGDFVREGEGDFCVVDAYDCASQVLEALIAAEAEGFYHLSLSPSSIMVQEKPTKGHTFTLTDMGHSEMINLLQGEEGVTSLIRRPELLAPEIYEGSAPSVKTGQYLLGHLLYWMLSGQHPCAGLSMEESYAKHKAGGFTSLFHFRPEMPKDFVSWLEVLMQPQADQRYASLDEAIKALPAAPKRIFSKKVVLPPTPISEDDLITA